MIFYFLDKWLPVYKSLQISKEYLLYLLYLDPEKDESLFVQKRMQMKIFCIRLSQISTLILSLED